MALRLVVLMPVFNDWPAVEPLVALLGKELAAAGLAARVVLVDDGSPRPMPDDFLATTELGGVSGVRVVHLRRNVGSTRAIVLGLAYLHRRGGFDAVVVMDADGEDRPADVARLVERYEAEGRKRIVFAERAKRSEGVVFRVFYQVYRGVHRLMTGQHLRVGNFSVVPRPLLGRLMAVGELWNHYAAGILKARVPHALLPTERGHRLAGKSQMNFVGLVVHGLSAVSVFSEVVGVRALVATSALAGLSALGLLGVVAVRLFTDLAIPGWATFAGGMLAILLVQLLGFSFAGAMLTLSARNAQGFLPLRDWQYFVRGSRKVVPRG